MTLGFFSKSSLVQWPGRRRRGRAPACCLLRSLAAVCCFSPCPKAHLCHTVSTTARSSLPLVFKISHSTNFEEDLQFKKWGAQTQNAGEQSECFSELLNVDVTSFLGALKDQLMPSFYTRRDWKIRIITEMHIYIFVILNTQGENIMNPIVRALGIPVVCPSASFSH